MNDISPDGRLIIRRVPDGTPQGDTVSTSAFILATGEKVADLVVLGNDKAHPVKVRSRAFSSDGRLLAAACEIELTRKDHPAVTLPGFESSAHYTATYKHELRVWDTSTWALLQEIPLPLEWLSISNRVYSIEFSPDAAKIVVVADSGSYWCDLHPVDAAPEFREHRGYKWNRRIQTSYYSSVTWSPDGEWFFLANVTASGEFFDGRTGESLGELEWPDELEGNVSPISKVAIPRDGRKLYTSVSKHGHVSFRGTKHASKTQSTRFLVIEWDVSTRRCRAMLEILYGPLTDPAYISIVPQGDLLAIGLSYVQVGQAEEHRDIMLVDPETGTERYWAKVGSDGSRVQGVMFTNSGERLAYATYSYGGEGIMKVSDMQPADPSDEPMIRRILPEPPVQRTPLPPEPMVCKNHYLTVLYINDPRLPTKDELHGVATALEAVGIIDTTTYTRMIATIDALAVDVEGGYVFPKIGGFCSHIEIPYELKHRWAFPYFNARNDSLRYNLEGEQALELLSYPPRTFMLDNAIRATTQFIIASAKDLKAEQEDLDANLFLADLRRRLARVFDIPETKVIVHSHYDW
jgi:hypothetical protein